MKSNKNKKTIRRRFVTLIEMMIVMFLIALITGVVAYNYRGTLEEGKAFKTKAGIEKLSNILSMALADDPSLDVSGDNWKQIVRSSPIVQNSDAIMKDGWGSFYEVTMDNDRQVVISSEKYSRYRTSNPGSMFK